MGPSEMNTRPNLLPAKCSIKLLGSVSPILSFKYLCGRLQSSFKGKEMQICSINHRITQLLSSSEWQPTNASISVCRRDGGRWASCSQPGLACVRVCVCVCVEVLAPLAFLPNRFYFRFCNLPAAKELTYSAKPNKLGRDRASPGI